MAKNGNDELAGKLTKYFSEKNIKKYLDKTSCDYRNLDPGLYLYEMAMKIHVNDRFSMDYIKLVYTTLKSWNMDSRGAKLCNFSRFSKSIQKNMV